MPRALSSDLKARIPVLHRKGYPVNQICSILGIKQTFVRNTLKLYSKLGVVSNSAVKRQRVRNARKRASTASATNKTSVSAVRRAHTLERARYMNQIGDEVSDPNMLLFVDQPARPQENVLKSKTHDFVEGTVSDKHFLTFLSEDVMYCANPYPGPRSVIVMENSCPRRAKEIRALVEGKHQCKLIFLPRRSPGYNPIERAFLTVNGCLLHEMHDLSFPSIERAFHKITPEDIESYFRACGYVA